MKLFKKSTTLYSILIIVLSFFAIRALVAKESGKNNTRKSEAVGIIFQSADGGKTWQDISRSLPGNEQPQGFFAGPSEIYLRVKNEVYRSKNNLTIPVWEKDTVPDPGNTSIIFNHSGIVAFNYGGYYAKIHRDVHATGYWVPVYTSFKNHSIHTIFETSDGTVFVGCDSGLYKSAIWRKHWKRVLNEGWITELAESDGVLIGTGQSGIMRSTDNGEHWQWVINEGGAGIVVERIDSGFAAISYSTAIQSRRVHISVDKGKTWTAIDEKLPPSFSISSIKQIGKYLLCGHPDGIFRSSDKGKTWTIVHPGVDNRFTLQVKVFKLYVSGKMVYAVAEGGGC